MDEQRVADQVKHAQEKGQEAKGYGDFRQVLERKDIDIICIATPPHWHALISIAAAEAGKDVLCEKPLTRTIGEGRAVVNAFKRYNRILQVGTFGRFGALLAQSGINIAIGPDRVDDFSKFKFCLPSLYGSITVFWCETR